MSNSYFTNSNPVVKQTLARASQVNANLDSLEAGFDKLPDKVVLDTGRVTYALDTGAADVYAVALHKTATSYYTGMHITMKVATTNTGASTLDVDGIGAKAVKLVNGTDPQAGDLTAGDIVDLVYDGTNFVIISVVRSIINGQAAMSDAEIKTAYENNADTNAYTNAAKAKVDFLTVTGAINLDTVKTKIDYLTVTGAVDLDSHKTKLDFITVTEAIDLDNVGGVSKTSSGAITAGDPVAINSGGTVSTITEANGTLTKGTTETFTLPTTEAVWNGTGLVHISKGKALNVTGDEDDVASPGVAFVITYDEDDVSGTITAHTPVQYESGFTHLVAACKVSENKVLAIYADDGNTDYATAVVLRVDGVEVEAGTPVVFKSAAVNTYTHGQLDCCPLADNKAVVFCRTASASDLFVCSVSGLTPAFSAATAVDSNAAVRGDLCQLDTDLFFLAYQDSGDSDYLNGVVGQVNDTTIDLKTPARIYAVTSNYKVGCDLLKKENDGYRIVAYGGSSSGSGYLNLLTVDGDSFTVDVSTAAVSQVNSFSAMGDTVALWYLSITTEIVQFYDLDLSADSITSVDSWVPGTVQFHASLLWVKERLLMVAYLTASLGQIDLLEVRQSARNRFIGFASDSVSDATSVNIKTAGTEDDNQSGLTAAVDYYLDWDGSLTTEETDVFAGTATSATTILVGGGISR